MEIGTNTALALGALALAASKTGDVVGQALGGEKSVKSAVTQAQSGVEAVNELGQTIGKIVDAFA